MFDFSKRLEDFSAGRPTGKRVRSKYDRTTKYSKYPARRTEDKLGDQSTAPKKYSSFWPAHSWSRTISSRPARPGYSTGHSSGGYSSTGRTSVGRPSSSAGRGYSSGSRGSSYDGRPSYGRPSFSGGRRGGSGGGRRLPPQPSYKQYMFTPTDASGELKHTPFEATKTFLDFGFHPAILKNVEKKGYEKPTEIQEKTFQPILDGRDVLALANTGSGKTAAFLMPIIHRMLSGVKKRVLVMVPTRELALQVQTEFQWIAQGTFLHSTSVVGGASAYAQIRDIKRGVHCIVATPGRLKDLYDRKVIDLSTYGHIVLDEFDRMLDMGFIEDIRKIMALLPAEKQTLMFSATMDASIEKHVNSFLNDPEKVTIKSEPVGSRVFQEVIFYATLAHKKEKLLELLKKDAEGKYLIFTRTKHEADRVGEGLAKLGFLADALHGNKSQGLRTRVTNKFRRDEIKILVATDVAARGLDIPDISHVINYDEPATREDYVHRIGRTARAGKQGTAYTFVKGGEH